MKPQQKQAVLALLERGVSQHEIARKLGVDRKTIRRLAQAATEPPANAPMATGPHPQNPPPRPPASGDERADYLHNSPCNIRLVILHSGSNLVKRREAVAKRRT